MLPNYLTLLSHSNFAVRQVTSKILIKNYKWRRKRGENVCMVSYRQVMSKEILFLDIKKLCFWT